MILYNYYIAYPLSDGTYLFPITQDSIASWGTGGANIGDVLFGSLNQGDSLSVEDIITYLNDIGTTAFGTAVNPIGMNPVNNPLSWSDLVSDITHGKPNIAATNKQSDNAHAVVILGIDSTKTGVYYWDPLNDPRTDTLLYYSYADMIDSPPYGIGWYQTLEMTDSCPRELDAILNNVLEINGPGQIDSGSSATFTTDFISTDALFKYLSGWNYTISFLNSSQSYIPCQTGTFGPVDFSPVGTPESFQTTVTIPTFPPSGNWSFITTPGQSGIISYYGQVTVRVSIVGTNDTAVKSKNFYCLAPATTDVIPLNVAWNMNSFNVIPERDTTAAVFGTDPAGFLFVKDNAGDLYCPYWGQDDLHYARVGQGYQVYTNVPDTLRVQGIPINYTQTPIALSSGWNMIAYPLPTIMGYESPTYAFASIDSSLILVKDNSGHVYWPSMGVDEIELIPGQGYRVLMNASASFSYPPFVAIDKRLASSSKPMLQLPNPRHYAIHAITGNNATLLAKQVTIGGKTVADSSEIGAYDASGSLVGSGTVICGLAAFAVWGKDPQTKPKDGLVTGEPVTFKLWDGNSEYPLGFQSQNGTAVKYGVDKVYVGELEVTSGYLITKFDLTQAYPNPFRGSVKISFDVPTIADASQQAIEINVYDLKGSLVKQLASGKYQAGRYSVAWNCTDGREVSIGSSIYIVRMKANNFDKRLKLLRVQ